MFIVIFYMIVFKVIELIAAYRTFADGDVKTKIEFWLTISVAIVPFSLLIVAILALLTEASEFYKSLS